jgi:CMP-N-acetylneuraminic acid synthetase
LQGPSDLVCYLGPKSSLKFFFPEEQVPYSIEFLEFASKIGEDIVVVWDSDDRSTDVIFRAGYMLAKALSVRSALLSKSDTASFQKIDKAIEAIRKQLGGFVELKTTSETIQNGATKILKRVEIMSIDLERQIDILFEQFVNIKGANNT